MADLAKHAEAADTIAAADAALRALDATLPDTIRALEIVRAFIVDRGLILYGGLAIDFALRAVNLPAIYSEDVLPDYDFYSPDSVGDATALSGALRAAGFRVRATRAIHVTTMRVRANEVWVADISYCPPAVFAAIPTIEYQGVRVRAPGHQAIDMHRALSFPLENPPMEVIEHRAGKDVTRFNLLAAAYPAAFGLAGVRGGAPVRTVARKAEIPASAGDFALHGYAAYGLYFAAAGKRAGGAPALAPPVLTRTGDAFSLTASLPAVRGRAVAPLEIVAGHAGNTSGRRFAPLMDWRVKTCDTGGLRAWLLPNSRLAVTTIRGVRVVSPQYVLLDLMLLSQTAESPAERAVHLAHYAGMLALIAAADGRPPFALFSGEVMGDRSRSAAYWSTLSQRLETLGLPRAIDESGLPPRSWGPDQAPVFDYAAAPLFQLDGAELGGC